MLTSPHILPRVRNQVFVGLTFCLTVKGLIHASAFLKCEDKTRSAGAVQCNLEPLYGRMSWVRVRVRVHVRLYVCVRVRVCLCVCACVCVFSEILSLFTAGCLGKRSSISGVGKSHCIYSIDRFRFVSDFRKLVSSVSQTPCRFSNSSRYILLTSERGLQRCT